MTHVPNRLRERAWFDGLATYLGTPGKAERDLDWHARDLDTGLRETVAALRG